MSLHRWLRLLALTLFCLIHLLFIQPFALAADSNEQIPLTDYHGATVPDWNNLSFSNFPTLQQGGQIQVPDSVVQEMGYNPSETWQAGDSVANVLKLGSLQDMGVDQFRLSDLAQIDHFDLNTASLNNFPLLKQQSISSLVQAVSNLGNYKLGQVQPLSDLVQSNLAQSGTGISNLQGMKLEDVANSNQFGDLSLDNLNLNQYSFSQIPDLDQAQLGGFQNWQNSTISQTPGLSNVPISQYPNSPLSYLGFIAIHDVTYGYKEHRVKTTAHSITGSNKVGFHYQCVQENGCAYLELNSPISLGIAGDPLGLHGAQWIKGGRSPGGQMVPGGEGILGSVNGGMEPTGRLPFGSAFKVVLIETNESQGEGQFGLFFRYCHHGVPELGCTPYFIGPVPWLPSHEKGLVFVGETQGTAPSGIQSPPVPQEVTDIVKQYGGDTDDGSGAGYGSDCAGKLAAAAPSGDRSYAASTIPKLLSAAQQYGVTDPGQIAYILATVQGEVDFNPRDEDDTYSSSGDCGSYCGRGDVQLTFQDNYARAGQALGIDLVNNPDMANDPDVAAKIAVLGMKNGWFTGVRLGNYIHGSTQDFTDARQIVNDSDRSAELAGYAQQYYQVLSQCSVSTGGATTTQTYAGQFISQANGNATEQKIVAAINSHYGESTSDGPAGGDEACAWEVNQVLQDAVGHTVGSDPDDESSIEEALSSGAGTRVSPSQAHAGDVIVFSNPATNQGHIGFCTDDGCNQVISNSSSKSSFSWSGTRSSYDSYFGVDSSSHIYRVN